MGAVPEQNTAIFKYLFAIENGLRELIISSLATAAGPRWYRSRLPGDVLDKYRQGATIERSTSWTQLVPHHPMYYVDFADLRKILERDDNWRDSFEVIFKRRDLLASTLSELEFIRNKIAHNRKATLQDLRIAR